MVITISNTRYQKNNALTNQGLEGRKNFFYLTTHSTHFYLHLYGIRHMIMDHSDSKRGNPLLPHGLFFLISNKGYVVCIIPQAG